MYVKHKMNLMYRPEPISRIIIYMQIFKSFKNPKTNKTLLIPSGSDKGRWMWAAFCHLRLSHASLLLSCLRLSTCVIRQHRAVCPAGGRLALAGWSFRGICLRHPKHQGHRLPLIKSRPQLRSLGACGLRVKSVPWVSATIFPIG